MAEGVEFPSPVVWGNRGILISLVGTCLNQANDFKINGSLPSQMFGIIVIEQELFG